MTLMADGTAEPQDDSTAIPSPVPSVHRLFAVPRAEATPPAADDDRSADLPDEFEDEDSDPRPDSLADLRRSVHAVRSSHEVSAAHEPAPTGLPDRFRPGTLRSVSLFEPRARSLGGDPAGRLDGDVTGDSWNNLDEADDSFDASRADSPDDDTAPMDRVAADALPAELISAHQHDRRSDDTFWASPWTSDPADAPPQPSAPGAAPLGGQVSIFATASAGPVRPPTISHVPTAGPALGRPPVAGPTGHPGGRSGGGTGRFPRPAGSTDDRPYFYPEERPTVFVGERVSESLQGAGYPAGRTPPGGPPGGYVQPMRLRKRRWRPGPMALTVLGILLPVSLTVTYVLDDDPAACRPGALSAAAVSQVAAVVPLAIDPPPIRTSFSPGEITHFGPARARGACLPSSIPSSKFVVALGPEEFDEAAACNTFVDIKSSEGTIRAKVTDLCPECDEGELDLSDEAFAELADLDQGRVRVAYRAVRNPAVGPLTVQAKDGSNPFWLALRIDNHGNPLRSVEVASSGQRFTQLNLEDFGFWVDDNGAGKGPFSVRVTDVVGHQVVLTGVRLAPDTVQNTRVRLYGPNAGVVVGAPKPVKTTKRANVVSPKPVEKSAAPAPSKAATATATATPTAETGSGSGAAASGGTRAGAGPKTPVTSAPAPPPDNGC